MQGAPPILSGSTVTRSKTILASQLLAVTAGHSRAPQVDVRPRTHDRGFLSSGSVAGNIRFGRPEATRAEIEAAARAVGAEPVIAGLPHGFDTQVGERGALLSAGERQLVAFARAWIADPALLVLDEATSNLDVVTEARLQQALRRLRQGRTTVLIAHRLSTVIDADQIAIVEDGRVVEAGPPTTPSPAAAASPSCTTAGSPAPPEPTRILRFSP
jgi:ABC-type transport system involved in Fe-S cluster assembly fused permease/ATPase subunit